MVDMHLRPVDLVLRAILEVGAVIGLLLGGPSSVAGPVGIFIGLVMPVAAAFLWATFRVPGDPGPSPVPVPGSARLALELVLLSIGALGWILAGWLIVGLLLGALIVGHYLMTAQRVRWLLVQR
jgi:hypothetical protein